MWLLFLSPCRHHVRYVHLYCIIVSFSVQLHINGKDLGVWSLELATMPPMYWVCVGLSTVLILDEIQLMLPFAFKN